MSEDKTKKVEAVTIGNRLYGRLDIFSSVEELTAENIIPEVNTALEYHFMNVMAEEYLYWYRRGIQPVLHRTKERNEWILNKIVENHAEEIVDFKNGYFLMEPTFYVSRTEEARDKVEGLNEYLYRSGKQQADNIIADWFHTVGKAALYVEETADDEIPILAFALDPRAAFVVKSLRPGNRHLYAVHVVLDGDTAKIDVYTKDKIFRLSGSARSNQSTAFPVYESTAITVEKEEKNILGHIPIIEYRYNSVNMGAFESVITILDSINDIQSNRADGVAQFIQSLAVAVNCQFEEDVTAKKIKESGLLALSSIGENKADFKILSEELNQDQTQTLIDNLYEQALRICSMPCTTKGGKSTSDTGSAVIFRDGWEQAGAAARNTEDLFRDSNAYFDEILVDVLKRRGLLDVRLVDFKLNFLRNETANIQSKAQAYQTMVAGGLHPELALKKSGLSNDPVSDMKMSEPYLKMIWGDPYAAPDKEGEAQIIETDNFTGNDDVEGSV